MKLLIGTFIAAFSFMSVAQAQYHVEYSCNFWNAGPGVSQEYGDIQILEDGYYPVTARAIRFTHKRDLLPVKYNEFNNLLNYVGSTAAVTIQFDAGAASLQGEVYLNLVKGNRYVDGVKTYQINCGKN